MASASIRLKRCWICTRWSVLAHVLDRDGFAAAWTRILTCLLRFLCSLATPQHNEFADRGDGGIDGLTVTMVGDLKNGRTVHSLCKLLSHFRLGSLHLVSPPSLRMPQAVLDCLQQRGITVKEHESLDEVMKETDVLYGQ